MTDSIATNSQTAQTAVSTASSYLNTAITAANGGNVAEAFAKDASSALLETGYNKALGVIAAPVGLGCMGAHIGANSVNRNLDYAKAIQLQRLESKEDNLKRKTKADESVCNYKFKQDGNDQSWRSCIDKAHQEGFQRAKELSKAPGANQEQIDIYEDSIARKISQTCNEVMPTPNNNWGK